jgi:TetR/AcrR family transcriptional repressor of nem operon
MAEKKSTKDRIMDAAELLIHERGFSAASVDSILEAADASKGAFFHHFPSKDALGEALVARYARDDADLLDEFMERAESLTDDPAEQVVSFVQQFAEYADDITAAQPGCLFVSFIYELGPGGGAVDALIRQSVEAWRKKLLEKLELAAATRPQLLDMDLPGLADQVFSTFEGGFILVRATGDPSHLRRQLTHLRRYLELLLEVEAPTPVN